MNELVEQLRGNMTIEKGSTLDLEAADRIEELEAALAEATKGLDYYEECMALRAENEKLLFAHQWIAKQANEIEKLKDLVAKLAPTYANTPFIHHMTGAEKGKMPEFIWVTPAYGADWSQVYERTDRIVGGMGS